MAKKHVDDEELKEISTDAEVSTDGVVEVKPTPEEVAASENLAAEKEKLAEAEKEVTASLEKVEEIKADVEKAKAHVKEVAPPKTYFVHTRDSVHEATVLKEYPDGTIDLQVPGLRTQEFVSGASSGIVNQLPGFFGRVRRGSGRADVGSYFVE